MKIEIANATIRIDDHGKGYYSSHFKSPFNCFISIDFSKTKVFLTIDKKKIEGPWVANDELFKKILSRQPMKQMAAFTPTLT